ncbi:hypothetical protein Scel_87740 [Streptomyces cellostaticus]|nr:hypothetical protein Scel_87740 [Streptomyces cellostaticus]
MIKSSRIAAITFLAVGGLGVSAPHASAAAPRVDPVPVGGLVAGPMQFPPLPAGVNRDGSPTGGALYSLANPIGFGPLNVAVPAVGLL